MYKLCISKKCEAKKIDSESENIDGAIIGKELLLYTLVSSAEDYINCYLNNEGLKRFR